MYNQSKTKMFEALIDNIEANLFSRITTSIRNETNTMNRVRDIIESYSDAEEKYREQKDIWYKCALLNDPESSRQHYQMSTGGLY